MTTDRGSLGLPVFSAPATDEPVPAQAGALPPPRVAQGADFRQPPGEEVPDAAPAGRPLGGSGLVFSDPARQI
ncbi:hypothetical protein [Kitasatospora azatica]|uniref:hypothetical protein n=1 Tax=Kitasatospora azatica TaxID=58347 RepID=UPI0005663E69|nr:hypothetical protein [Kitasatospora azatica]